MARKRQREEAVAADGDGQAAGRTEGTAPRADSKGRAAKARKRQEREQQARAALEAARRRKREEAETYLLCWAEDKASWKFSKAHQEWVIKNVLDRKQISKSLFEERVVPYLKSVTGNASQRIRKIAHDAVASVEEDGATLKDRVAELEREAREAKKQAEAEAKAKAKEEEEAGTEGDGDGEVDTKEGSKGEGAEPETKTKKKKKKKKNQKGAAAPLPVAEELTVEQRVKQLRSRYKRAKTLLAALGPPAAAAE